MPRPLKRGIQGAITILSKDIDKYASRCGSNFYETDVISKRNLVITKDACYWIKYI